MRVEGVQLKYEFSVSGQSFSILESCGHFIFCLSEVHPMGVVGGWDGGWVGGRGVVGATFPNFIFHIVWLK